MTSSSLTLKNPKGWFAAGAEVGQAMMLLSDGAFKLFVYLCLNARRDTGTLDTTQTELARGLKKSHGTIRKGLREMEAAGICRSLFQHSPAVQGSVRITEAFWPYRKGGEQPSTDAADRFVAEVREILQERACIRPSFSTADEILARQWFSNAVPLERIRHAVLWGCGRKYVSWRNNQTYAPISSLAYFVPILDEIERQNIPDDYWDYILYRVERMEKLWIENFGKKPGDSRLDASATGEIPQGGDVMPESAKPSRKPQLRQTLTNSPGKKERR
jgi:DNA-binding Lrp family transcriptional regulator